MGFVKRLGIIAAGHATKEGADSLFDYIIYPAVTAGCLILISNLMSADEAIIWGPILSISIMIPITGIINYGYLKVYDNVKLDAFGAELLKNIRHVRARGLLGFVVNPFVWLLDWTLVLLIACFEDSFVATVYARKGIEQFNGLSRRDWIIFVVTTVISNVFWVYLVSYVYVFSVAAWQYLYDRLPPSFQDAVDMTVAWISGAAAQLLELIMRVVG